MPLTRLAQRCAPLAFMISACTPTVAPGPPPHAPPVAEREPTIEPPAPPAVPRADCPALDLPPIELIESPIDVPVPPIVDPRTTMAPLYERLASVVRGTADDHVRIAVYGDSNMTMDWITGEMRRTLQGRLGDGGHGYIALGRPWNWYRHMDVRSGHDPRDWTPFAVSTAPAPDRCYGFAGIAARSERMGATTWAETAPADSPIGTRVSRIVLYYLKKPGAGALDIVVDGQKHSSVRTEDATMEAAFHPFELPDAPHRIEVVSASSRPSVVFGLTLERGDPSVIVDSLGVGAVSGPLLLRQDREVMHAALARRKYDLVILLLGSNQVWPEKYAEWMGQLIARFREATPGVAVLVMTPVDQVESQKAWRSVPNLTLVAKQNEAIAAATGSAFWDFRGAMGGEASMRKFIASGMGQADGIHLTQRGASYMGRRIVYALWRGLGEHVKANPAAGCAR